MLKGVVFVCIIKIMYLCEIITVSFLSHCVLCKKQFGYKKIIWLFFLDLQVKQQLNLRNSCQILRSFLILLNKINNRLLYWVISMQDLNHGAAWWHNITGWHWHWFINNSAWTTATNIRVKPLALISFVLIKPNWQLIVFSSFFTS